MQTLKEKDVLVGDWTMSTINWVNKLLANCSLSLIWSTRFIQIKWISVAHVDVCVWWGGFIRPPAPIFPFPPPPLGPLVGIFRSYWRPSTPKIKSGYLSLISKVDMSVISKLCFFGLRPKFLKHIYNNRNTFRSHKLFPVTSQKSADKYQNESKRSRKAI